MPGAAAGPQAAGRAFEGGGALKAPGTAARSGRPYDRGHLISSRLPLLELAPGQALPSLPRSAWIEIDLDALVANVRLFEKLLPGVEVQAVVKGDAYGHGAVAVSRALQDAGVTSLGVATFDEAVELRQAGISLPILILYPMPPELIAEAAALDLAVTVGDPVLLDRTLGSLGGAARLSRLEVHLEVETGLGRGGLLPAEVPAAVAAIAASSRAWLGGVWSHLQDAGNRDRTSAQADRLSEAATLLEDSGFAVPVRHLAASGGVLAESAPPFDRVRIGLSMYGLVPAGLSLDEREAAAAAALRPVMALRARPVRVADLPAGTGISYGPSFVTSRPSRIASLPLGYADGWPRSLSNRAHVLVRGRRVPAVGTVAMDAIMVDVTDVPGGPVSVDDEFTLIGTQGSETIGATDVGLWGNTISYEIVTAMSGRLTRVYYAAARATALRVVALLPEQSEAGPGTGNGEGMGKH